MPAAKILILSLCVLGGLSSIVDAKVTKRDIGTYYHNGNNCFKCEPGKFVSSHCTEDYSPSVCVPCPPNTFQSRYDQVEMCGPCTPYCFSENMEVIEKCTAMGDLKCECQPGYYLNVIDEDLEIYHCEKHRTCPPGQIMSKNGTTTSDTECSQCPEGQFYNNTGHCMKCSSCSDRNMTQLTSCSATADAVCGDLHGTTTQLTTNPVVGTSTKLSTDSVVHETEDNSTLLILAIIFTTAFLVCVVMFFVIRHFYYQTGTFDVGSVESIGQTSSFVESGGVDTKPLLPTSYAKRQRTFSDSSVVSTRPVSVFPDMRETDLWKRDVFDLLSHRLTDWRRFMRLLPANKAYRSTVVSRCEQIQLEEPHNIPEQIHKALIEWSQSNDGSFVKIDSILDTVEKTSDSDCKDLYNDVCNLCCKLANEQKISAS